MAAHNTRMVPVDPARDRFTGACSCGRTWPEGTAAQINQALRDHVSAATHEPGDDR